MDRVYRSCGLAAVAVLYGPIMDQRRWVARDSPELRRVRNPDQWSLPRGVLEGEGSGLVLTEGGVGGGLPEVSWRRWGIELDAGAIRAQMERADARNGKVVWRRCSRVSFVGRGWQEMSERGRSPVGVEWSPLMVTVLRS
jgi:hypothetical protein